MVSDDIIIPLLRAWKTSLFIVCCRCRRNEARSYALSARDVLHTSSSSDDAASSSSHPLSSNRTVQPVLEQLGERARRRAAGALLVLQSMQPILSRVLSERDLDDLMQSIYLLQRKSFVSSLTLHVMHAEPVHFAHCMSLRAGQLASLLVMFVASLVSQDSCLRTAYIAAASKSHVAYLQQSRTAAQETSLLNWLLSVGLSSGQMPSFRRLSLHLAAELLPHMLPNTAEKLESQVAVPGLVQSSNALRNQATLLLAQHVEKTLQMSTYSQSDVHFALLPFFAALAHSEAGPCCYDKTNSAILPLPDLVATLCDASPSLGSAVCRGLGSVALWQTYALDMAVTPSSARQSENEENVSSATAPTLSLPTLSAKYLLHEKVFRVLANQSSREARTQETGGSSTPSLPPSILPLASLCVRLLSHRSDKVRTQLNAVRSNPHAKSTETRHW
ncbi:hypothetical protein EON64_00985 [archaeon]|nr:MAG: hypothetical protein EON64_00985 [archaeon]